MTRTKKTKPAGAEKVETTVIPLDEMQRQRYAWYYDSGGPSEVDEAAVAERRFWQAVAILARMLEAYENIGVPWPMGNTPDAAIPRLPSQNLQNAIHNHATLTTVHLDAGDLACFLPEGESVRQIGMVLARIGWDLSGSTLEWSAEDVAKAQGEEAGIEIIREAVRRSCVKGSDDLKRLIWEREAHEADGESTRAEQSPRGRTPKYTAKTLELAAKAYDAQLLDGRDAKGAWNYVKEQYDFSSGEAARKAVERWKTGQK